MGKTATAIKAANEIRDNDDNTAVVYINCNVVNSCDDLAVKISQQIYHFPLNEFTAEIKRRLISEKDLLIILLLDNFQPRPQGFSLKKWVGPGKGPGIGWSRVYLTP